MTVKDDIIIVEADEAGAQMPALLHAVERERRAVRICRDGKTIAVLQAPPTARDPLQVHPELKATHIADDAFAPLDEEDWPENCR